MHFTVNVKVVKVVILYRGTYLLKNTAQQTCYEVWYPVPSMYQVHIIFFLGLVLAGSYRIQSRILNKSFRIGPLQIGVADPDPDPDWIWIQSGQFMF